MDPRRRRALFRAWHRGTREMDLILGRFTDEEIGTLNEEELRQFEQLLEAQDADLYDWVTGRAATPAKFDTEIFRRLCAFHAHPPGR